MEECPEERFAVLFTQNQENRRLSGSGSSPNRAKPGRKNRWGGPTAAGRTPRRARLESLLARVGNNPSGLTMD
jgi:hypothetical protein